LSQKALAKLCGLTQGAISRAENPDYGDLTFNTVLKIARGLDVAFVGRFVSFGDLDDWTHGRYSETFDVPNFTEEDRSVLDLPADVSISTVGAAPTATYGASIPRAGRLPAIGEQSGTFTVAGS
jgi:transcriptional regulator with XRE-family HTH domain